MEGFKHVGEGGEKVTGVKLNGQKIKQNKNANHKDNINHQTLSLNRGLEIQDQYLKNS